MLPRMLRSSAPVLTGLLQAALAAGGARPASKMAAGRRQFRPRHDVDGVSRGSQLVYVNSNLLGLYMTAGVVVPAAGLTLAASLYNAALHPGLPAVLLDLNAGVGPGLVLGAGGVALVEAVRRVYAPSVSRIYYDERQYVFTLVRLYAAGRRPNLQFTARDVKRRELRGAVRGLTGNYVIKGQTVYLHAADFKHKSYFTRLTEWATREEHM